MNDGAGKPTREQRLAARLRANLRLRKAQARALREADKPRVGAVPDPSQSD